MCLSALHLFVLFIAFFENKQIPVCRTGAHCHKRSAVVYVCSCISTVFYYCFTVNKGFQTHVWERRFSGDEEVKSYVKILFGCQNRIPWRSLSVTAS